MRNPLGCDGFPRHGAQLAALAIGAMFGPAAGAHHAIGGRIPSTGWEGLLSGLAHPILGLDHFAFVVAAGLIAALHRRGALIPVAFVIASLVGTGIHLLSWELPTAEPMISLSVLAFGVLLIARQLRLPIVMFLASAAGIFHGYAYGESIVGAEMTPLSAYLLGLALVQLATALAVQWLFRTVLLPTSPAGRVTLRFAGIVIGFVGLAYLATQ